MRSTTGGWDVGVPGSSESPDDRRDDMHQSELGDGRNLFDDVVAKEHSLGDERARVTGHDADRFGRVDEVSGDVAVAFSRKRVDGM